MSSCVGCMLTNRVHRSSCQGFDPITSPISQPDISTPQKRGAYLVQIGACQWCHTLRDVNRRSLPGLEFAGGDLTITPYSEASSANITPDPSGISYYDEAQFLKTIHTGKVGARQLSPHMPWWYLAQMSDGDLKSVFAFLRTVRQCITVSTILNGLPNVGYADGSTLEARSIQFYVLE